jgi:hypothetical protein
MSSQVMPDVPALVLAKVLELIPTRERLGHCALVCTHWKAAANLATVSIGCHLRDYKLPALQSWIGQHATHLISIQVENHSEVRQLQLPCADLQQLTSINLSGLFLLLPDGLTSSSTPASAQAAAVTPATAGAAGELLLHATSASTQQLLLPTLRELKLRSCSASSTQLFLQLSRLTSLTKLDLDNVRICADENRHDSEREVQELCESLCALLPRLPQLQALILYAPFGVPNNEVSGACLQR